MGWDIFIFLIKNFKKLLTSLVQVGIRDKLLNISNPFSTHMAQALILDLKNGSNL